VPLPISQRDIDNSINRAGYCESWTYLLSCRDKLCDNRTSVRFHRQPGYDMAFTSTVTCRIFLVMVLSTIIKRTFSALVPTTPSLGDCKDIKSLLIPTHSARNRPYAAPVLQHKKHFGWDRMNTLERKASSLIFHTRNDRRLRSTPLYKWRIPIV
jgi:hypothetical protein